MGTSKLVRPDSSWSPPSERRSEPRNQPQPEPNCQYILRDSNRHIRNVQRPNQPSASPIAAECSGNGADCPAHRAVPQQESTANRDTRTS